LKGNPQKKPKTRSNIGWIILGAVILVGGIAWFSMRTTDESQQEAQVQTPAPSMKLTTLPPSMFIGRAREAYQVAQDIPEVLQQVQCYCGCKQSAGHENNLYCFTDGHGAG
jgi:hypothetical protein